MPAKKNDIKQEKESLSIEESLARIEAIIQTLESPDTGLQDAMKLYTENRRIRIPGCTISISWSRLHSKAVRLRNSTESLWES